MLLRLFNDTTPLEHMKPRPKEPNGTKAPDVGNSSSEDEDLKGATKETTVDTKPVTATASVAPEAMADDEHPTVHATTGDVDTDLAVAGEE